VPRPPVAFSPIEQGERHGEGRRDAGCRGARCPHDRAGTGAGQRQQVRRRSGGKLRHSHGQDFEGTDASAGFDAGAFVNLGSWQFGAGYARTAYGHEDAAGDFVVSSVFIEPRLRFGSESARWRPYLATRIGRVSASIDEPSTGGTISVDGDGLLLGAAAGLLIDLAASFQLALAAHVSFISVDYGGDSGFSSEEGGGQVGVRAGLRFNIPRRE
jgi:hypothetical protein